MCHMLTALEPQVITDIVRTMFNPKFVKEL
jgi:hypothetical protein